MPICINKKRDYHFHVVPFFISSMNELHIQHIYTGTELFPKGCFKGLVHHSLLEIQQMILNFVAI